MPALDPLSPSVVRRLGPDDAPVLRELRAEALVREPFAFGSSPGEDVFCDPERTAAILEPSSEGAVFGGFEGDALVAMAGLVRATKPKLRHRAEVYGTYVTPGCRGRGHGRAVMVALLGHARETGVGRVALEVTEAGPAALALYRSLGFREWGRETGYLLVDGRAVDAIHMGLGLARAFEQGGPRALARTTVLVRDLDAAIEFYGRLGFRVLHDSSGPPARLVHVGLAGQEPLGLWLMPTDAEGEAPLGRQAGEHPFLVLYVEDAEAEYVRLAELGVELGSGPGAEQGSVHFTARDLEGNRLVFVQLEPTR